ncbi:MAG: peroxidase [Acidobacteriota bacterium]|nr:peroxidase [Acidobacteriota bacterium]MDH3529578.1 peroxidase [Acidobacteriota bacterium]
MTLDDELVDALCNDYENAPLDAAERAMCDYSIRLTKDPVSITPKTHEELRAVGFDDTAILQITIIASWFNYINRVADALGVGREGEFED